MKPWRAALTSATASGKSTRIASRSAIACSSERARDRDLRERRRGELDRGVQRQRRELLALGLLHRLGLLLGELAQAAQQILGIAAEREAEACRLPCTHPSAAAARAVPRPRRRTPRRFPPRSASALANGEAWSPSARSSAARGRADRVEVGGRGDDGRRADRALERERGLLGLLDPGRLLGESGPPRAAPAAPRAGRRPRARRQARRGRRSRRPRGPARAPRPAGARRRAPSQRALLVLAERDEVGAPRRMQARRRAPRSPRRRRPPRDAAPLELVRRAAIAASRTLARRWTAPDTRAGEELFAPLGPTYDRYAPAALLRPGSALAALPRLADRGRPGRPRARRRDRDRRGRARARPPEGLRRRRRRPEPRDARRGAPPAGRADRAGRGERRRAAVRRRRVRRPHLHLPAALRRRPARRSASSPGSSARAGRSPASSSAFPRGLWRALWELHVRAGLPAVGLRLPATAGARPARSSAPRSAAHYERWPLERQLEAWREAGNRRGRALPMSLGGGDRDVGTEEVRPAFYALRTRRLARLRDACCTCRTRPGTSPTSRSAPPSRPVFHTDRMVWTMAAFALALGVAAHMLDELNGRPLRTRDPGRRAGRARGRRARGARARSASGRPRAWGCGLLVFVAAGALARPGLQPRVVRGRASTTRWGSPSPGAGFPCSPPTSPQAETLRADGDPRRRIRDRDDPRPAHALDPGEARPPRARNARGRRADGARAPDPAAGRTCSSAAALVTARLT